MHPPSIVALATAFLGGGLALAQAARPPPSPIPSPGVVLGELHAVNTLEVELGNQAQSRAAQLEVKQFGQHMVKAHTRMDAHVSEYAKKHHLTVTPPPEDPQHQVAEEADATLKRRLESLQGPAFDRAYAQAMLEGHGKVLTQLIAWQSEARDPELKDFIDSASKEVAQHKQEAADLVALLDKRASR